ncbi:AraC family transcriptional regulator [Flammeovirga sp. OC4]|uniref:AraC family transcriptional regulator n=1 Tax=Flammeovirga sp. OC4 TaxID=1382345 RepID=UPI000693A884|nr:AraC family transcriptional regulator [Flammeovirga sp. OC4]
MKHNSNIIVESGIIIYAGKVSETKLHKHYAIQIGFVISGNYKLYINDIEYRHNNFIIHSNVPHKHTSDDGALLCILVDPTTDLGNTLVNNYPAPYQPLSVSKEELNCLQDKLNSNQEIDDLEMKIFRLLKITPVRRTMDKRIFQLIEKMNHLNTNDIDFDSLIETIPLSKSRIRFLFKQQTGLSIQRYILWLRIKKAIYQIMQNKSLSEAAYIAGFADYSHLSRVVRQVSGMTMKVLLKNSYFVQDS